MSSGLTKGWGAFVDWRRVALVTVAGGIPLALVPLITGEFVLHVLVIGAYVSGLLIYHLQTPLVISIPAGILTAGLAGYLLGRLVLRMRTIYLSVATWAFAETYRIILTAAYDFTRGDLGLSVPSLYGNVRPISYYYTFVAAAGLCVLITHVVLRSPIGYFMRAVKDDQMRAQSLGVDTTRVKLFAFTLSSAMAGLAGVLYAHYVLTLTPAMVDFSEMARIIIIVVIGGLGSFIGPVLAAPPINFLSTYLQAFGEWSLVLFAAVVIVVMRSYPAGLAGLVEGQLRRWRRRAKR